MQLETKSRMACTGGERRVWVLFRWGLCPPLGLRLKPQLPLVNIYFDEHLCTYRAFNDTIMNLVFKPIIPEELVWSGL